MIWTQMMRTTVSKKLTVIVPKIFFQAVFTMQKPLNSTVFIKKKYLGMNVDKTPAYDALLKLQAQGKLSAVISQNFHGIPKGVSFQNLIELNGNFDSNKCPRCNKKFNMKYMIHAEGIPMCDRCKTAVRPDIRLLGERVNTILLTETELALEAADILLILGKICIMTDLNIICHLTMSSLEFFFLRMMF